MSDHDVRRIQRRMDEIARRERLGATGQFPHGRLNDEDEGGLRAAIAVEAGKVVIAFGKQVGWLALTPEQAVALAEVLRSKAEQARG